METVVRKLPKVTAAVRDVLRVFMADPSAELYGYVIQQAADVPSGTLYPTLARFEACGLVGSRFEESELFVGTGRPPRRYYWLTRHGAEWAEAALAPRRRRARRASPTTQRLAWGTEG